MATTDEILASRIIGFIEPLGNNARVTVLGYRNGADDYITLEKSKCKSVFYPEGKVFAGKFQFDRDVNPILPYSFIEFSVTQSQKSADFDGDDYIVDYDQKIIQKSFSSIINVNYQTSLESGFITQQEINSCINKAELKNNGGYFLIRSGDYLYGLFKYEASTDTVRPVKGKEANVYIIDQDVYQKCCIKLNQKEYFLGNVNALPFKQSGIIDCMDDKQLGEWFKDQLKTCAEAEKFLSIKKEVFQNFASKFKETNDVIDEIRLERAKGKLDSLEFTFKEIKELLDTNSSLTQVLNDTLKQMKDEYQSSWASTLEAAKAALNNEINTLTKQRDKLKSDIDSVQTKYSEKEKVLDTAFQEKKCKIEAQIKELESMRNEVKSQVPQIVKDSFDSIEIEPIEFGKAGSTFTILEEESAYDFSKLLKENLELDNIPEVLKNQLKEDSPLFINKACFIPSVSWAYYYAKAVRNSKLFIMHVEHDWLHYIDFMNNGLASVLESCYENEETNNILVLDSLNLTQPECGLQPFLDVISGYSIIIPGIGKAFPKNLKVLATIQDYHEDNRIGLPLNTNNYSAWGRIASTNDKIIIDSNILDCNENIGYFEPKDLKVSKINDNSKQVDNGYFN